MAQRNRIKTSNFRDNRDGRRRSRMKIDRRPWHGRPNRDRARNGWTSSVSII